MKNCENNQTYGKISHAELNDTRGRSFGTKHFPLVVVTILRILKSLVPKYFKFVVCNPCQSSPSLTILVPLGFITISFVLFYLSKLPFLGFLQFKDNLVRSQSKSKYRD